MPGLNPNIARTKSITGSGSLGSMAGSSRRMPFGCPVVPDEYSIAAPSDSAATGLCRTASDGGLVGLPASRQVGWSGHEHALEARAFRGGGFRHRPPRGRAEQHPRLRVGHDVGDLVRRQVGVDEREIQAGPLGAALDLEHPDAVFHEDGDVVAALEPGSPQQVRHPVGSCLELGERHGLARRAHDDGCLIRVVLSMLSREHASPST